MFWIFNVLAVMLLCVLCTGIMIPQILLISFRKRLFDEPDERKIHQGVVPRLGGLAFAPVMVFSIVFVLGLDFESDYSNLWMELVRNPEGVAFGFCALMLIYVVGMADDLVGIQYKAKFLAQLICAIIIIVGKLDVNNFQGFLGLYIIPNWLSYIVTIFLTLYIVNAFNLIDGIDGLASSLAASALIFYGTTFYLAGEYLFAMMAAGAIGVLVPFFYYNVFGNPAKHNKIFMGDAGSLWIGMLICIMSFKVMNMAAPVNYHGMNMLLVAMTPLVIPCFDVIRVFYIRICNGKSPFLPDKQHIHHTFLKLGFSQRTTLMFIVGGAIAITLCNIIMSFWLNVNIIIVIDAVAFYLTMFVIRPRIHANA